MHKTHHWINPTNSYPKFYNNSHHVISIKYEKPIKYINPINKYKYTIIIMIIFIIIINLIYYN